jgi:hypothetical protein
MSIDSYVRLLPGDAHETTVAEIHLERNPVSQLACSGLMLTYLSQGQDDTSVDANLSPRDRFSGDENTRSKGIFLMHAMINGSFTACRLSLKLVKDSHSFVAICSIGIIYYSVRTE